MPSMDRARENDREREGGDCLDQQGERANVAFCFDTVKRRRQWTAERRACVDLCGC